MNKPIAIQRELKIGTTRGMKYIQGLKAEVLINALARKHQKDVFVSECKNGSTWMRNHQRLDAWVLLSTFSPLTCIGYEVKVSRQDFEQDQKWVDYLDLCHRFYFVCPAGMVRRDELPNHVGLMWLSRGGKLHEKRRAERLEPDPEKLVHLMSYVLMWRAAIVADRNQGHLAEQASIAGNGDHLASLRHAVEQAKERESLAYFIKGHVRDVEERQQKRESNLKMREESVVNFTKRLARLGIVWNPEDNQWSERFRVDEEIAKLRNTLSDRDLDEIRRYGRSMVEVAEGLSKMRNSLGESHVTNSSEKTGEE